MNTETADAGSCIKSVSSAFKILDVVAKHDGPISLKEIGVKAGVSPSKAHRYLQSLCRCGLLSQAFKSGTYDLGVATMRLGLAAVNRVDVINRAGDALADLVEQLDADAFIAVWSELGPTVVRCERSKTPAIAMIGPGVSFPIFTSATGLAFASFVSDTLLSNMIAREADGDAKKIAEISRHVQPKLQEIRRDKVARYSSALVQGRQSIAAPIFSINDQVVACVTLVSKGTERSSIEGTEVETLLRFCKKFSLPKRGYFDATLIEEKIAV